jgi:hypothetical protein
MMTLTLILNKVRVTPHKKGNIVPWFKLFIISLIITDIRFSGITMNVFCE